MSSTTASPQNAFHAGNYSLQEIVQVFKTYPIIHHELIMPSFRGRIPVELLEKMRLIFTNIDAASKADIEGLKNFSAKFTKFHKAFATIEITNTQEEEKIKSSTDNPPSGKQWMPSLMPTDVLVNTFTFLDLGSLVTLRRVNKTFDALRPQVQKNAASADTMKISVIEEVIRLRKSTSWNDLVILRKVGLLGPRSSAEKEAWAKTGRALPCLSRLTTILSDGIKLIDDAFLNDLRMMCPNVSSIEIELNEKITSAVLKAICAWPFLEKLSISVDLRNVEGRIDLSHLSQCLNLKELDLDFCYSSPKPGFGAAIAQGCSQLKSFRLKGPWDMSEEECLAVVRGCSQLEEIEVTCPNSAITGVLLQELGKGCPKLRSATFNDMLDAGSLDFEVFAAGCKKLEVLILHKVELEDDWFGPLLEARLPLTKLDVSNLHGLSSETIQKICHATPTLRELNLNECGQVDDECLGAIASSCKNLRKIDLYLNKKITDKGIERLTESCSNLTDIDLRCCFGITSEGLKNLFKNCLELNTLRYERMKFSMLPAIIEGYKGQTKLTRVDLNKLHESNDPFQITEEELIALIERSLHLTFLDLSFCNQVNDRVLFAIAKSCPNLQELNLQYCTQISPLGIMALEHCSQLKTLNLSGTQCSTESYAWVTAIGRLASLENLTMGISTDSLQEFLMDGLSELSKCRKLVTLAMRRTFLEKNELLQIAKAFPKLRKIHISPSEIQGISEMASLYPNLKVFNR